MAAAELLDCAYKIDVLKKMCEINVLFYKEKELVKQLTKKQKLQRCILLNSLLNKKY